MRNNSSKINVARCVYLFLIKRIGFVLSLLSKGKRYVVFESLPDYSGSPRMICLEMEKRGLRNRYVFVWAIDKMSGCAFRDYDCVPFFGKLTLLERIKKNVIEWNSALIVNSHRAILKTNKQTIRIWTEHGGPLKQDGDYNQSLGLADYVLSLSDDFAKIDYSRFFPAVVKNLEQVLVLGHPANDELFVETQMEFFWEKILEHRKKRDFKKIIGWFPTFRQRVVCLGDDLDSVFPFGVPILKNRDDLTILNDYLHQVGTLLLVQIHHAQKRIYTIVNMSNIILINQNIKDECGVTNANLMHYFDALITDYSGAYHEFLLLNRPIGITVDDYEEYSKQVGFWFDFFDYIKGFYIKNLDDLKKFISEIADGIDSSRALRIESQKKIHKYVDGNSTNRVVDFISRTVS